MVRIPDSRFVREARRVDSRHDDAVDLSLLQPGVDVRLLAISSAGHRVRARIALYCGPLPRHQAGIAVLGYGIAIELEAPMPQHRS